MKKLFIDLKKEKRVYQLWENNLELSNFTKLPKDLIYNEVQPNYILPAKKSSGELAITFFRNNEGS